LDVQSVAPSVFISEVRGSSSGFMGSVLEHLGRLSANSFCFSSVVSVFLPVMNPHILWKRKRIA